MPDRAVLFVDGSNWYHALKGIGIASPGRLDYAKLSQKLVGPRTWVATRYYIGQVRQVGNRRLYRDQRRFLAGLRNSDPRISTHLGRLEPRTVENEGARELQQYLHALSVQIDRGVFHDLLAIAARHASTQIMVEKAVDVMLAVDLVTMAGRDEFFSPFANQQPLRLHIALVGDALEESVCPKPGVVPAHPVVLSVGERGEGQEFVGEIELRVILRNEPVVEIERLSIPHQREGEKIKGVGV